MQYRRTWRFKFLVLMAAGAAGCGGSLGPPSLKSRDPLQKIPAIKMAVDTDDTSSETSLVAGLGSDDAALRFYSIEGLHRLTGNDFGYRYFDDEAARRPAVDRWKTWLRGRRTNEDKSRPSSTGLPGNARGGTWIIGG